MRILSTARDYYDRSLALAPGQDDAIQYLRTRRELAPMPDTLHVLMREVSRAWPCAPVETRRGSIELAPFLVAFCGKLHRGIHARHTRRGEAADSEVRLFYGWDELEAWAGQDRIAAASAPERRRRAASDRFAQAWLAAQGTLELNQFLIGEGIVILTCFEAGERYWIGSGAQAKGIYPGGAYRVVVDDTLGPLGFGQVFDATLAFQEIEMYVSGTVAEAAPPPLVLSEKDRIAQHGFDKWSFRRPPGSGKST
ncbi:hypothetical protein [Massilia sp. Leaf139]|uniref:hypothetical protein n=1 Tax=Massilia sp. Leaf139 TaxID=1736272 RepID=UPI0006FC24CF|nr:hypothetical protein [Massilia sp. Leaf139]KQQ86377.1 hypothetical protein ASF77_20595 [Massilia sp. Leaf139]